MLLWRFTSLTSMTITTRKILQDFLDTLVQWFFLSNLRWNIPNWYCIYSVQTLHLLYLFSCQLHNFIVSKIWFNQTFGSSCDRGAQRTIVDNAQAREYWRKAKIPLSFTPNNSTFLFADHSCRLIGSFQFHLSFPSGLESITSHHFCL